MPHLMEIVSLSSTPMRRVSHCYSGRPRATGISSLAKFAGTFLDEIARIRVGDARWDADDDAFVERIKSLHEKITPKLEMKLEKHLDEDDEFRERFAHWTESQGIEYEDVDEDEKKVIQSEFAVQAAYLLINKVLFYKILETSPTYADEIEPLAVSRFRVREDLEEYFDHIVKEVDFEAIFEPTKSTASSVPNR